MEIKTIIIFLISFYIGWQIGNVVFDFKEKSQDIEKNYILEECGIFDCKNLNE